MRGEAMGSDSGLKKGSTFRLSFGTAIAIMGVAIMIALTIIIRLMPGRFGFYLNEFDPYSHYYATNIIVQDVLTHGWGAFFNYFHTISYNFWYPYGRNWALTEYSGLDYLTAVLYILLHYAHLALSVYQFVAIFPVIIGGLFVIPIYFIIKELTGNKYLGVLGGFLIATLPGLVLRTDFGWYTGDAFALLFTTTAIMFVILAFNRHGVRSYIYAILAGLFAGYAETMWGGAINPIGVIALAMLISPFLVSPSRELLTKQIGYAIPTLIAAIYPIPGVTWLHNPVELIMYLAIGISAILYINVRYFNVKAGSITKYRIEYRIAITVGIILVLTGIALIIPHYINGRYLQALEFWRRLSPSAVTTVAEQTSVSGVQLLFTYGITVLLAIVGGYYTLKAKRIGSVLVTIFLLWSLYTATSFAELETYLSVAFAIMAPVGLYYLVTNIRMPDWALKSKERKTNVRGFKRHGRIITYQKVALVLVVIALIAFPAYTMWIPQNDSPTTIVTSSTILNGNVPSWIDALQWMANSSNTPANSVMVSWWDYGYWISVLGNRTTVNDGATTNTTQMAVVASLFLSNVTTAARIMEALGGNYVVVFATGIDPYYYYRDQYLYGYQLSGSLLGVGGDESKVPAMITIAQSQEPLKIGNMTIDNIAQPLYISNITGTLTPYFYNDTLLGQLLPLQWVGWGSIDTSSGQLVGISPTYQPGSSYFQLPLTQYGITYNTNSTGPFSLAYSSPRSEASDGIWAQVLIYHFNSSAVN